MADITKGYENSGMLIEWCHIPTTDLNNPELSTVRFKAFLTAFSEQYTSDWNQEQVFGRMDPIENFRATRRTISLGWTVIAHDDAEAFTNFKKISKFAKFLYPTYTPEKGFSSSGFGIMSASPLLRLKFMNLVQSTAQKGATEYSNQFANAPGTSGENTYGPVQTLGLVGRVDGLSINHELDDGFVMIPGPIAVPKRVSLSCTFFPIHEHAMGWDSNTKRFFSEEFPYGLTDGFPSTGGFAEVDQNDMAAIGETPGVETDNDGSNAGAAATQAILGGQ